jgi:hypothetical protein
VTTVTGLHDMDEFVQSQLILAVSFIYLAISIQFGSPCSAINDSHYSGGWGGISSILSLGVPV